MLNLATPSPGHSLPVNQQMAALSNRSGVGILEALLHDQLDENAPARLDSPLHVVDTCFVGARCERDDWRLGTTELGFYSVAYGPAATWFLYYSSPINQ